MSRLILAPMEGLADDILRDVLTRAGRYDWCVTEFVRVSGTVLPRRSFSRVCPELLNGARTEAGTPVRVQLMGSDPHCLAENAARLAELRPAGIDLNFGCPAPLVNRHRGGAALLDEPELLHRIAAAVRGAVPRELPVTAKMRLGIDDTARALDCARALEAGGAQELVVHARTRSDGYRPQVRWEWVARIRETVALPVIANGEVWNDADWRAIRAATGCADVMLGRGAVADPFLVERIRGTRAEQPNAADWRALQPLIADYWSRVQEKLEARHAPGRLKQWLGLLRRNYAGAEALWRRVRELRDVAAIGEALAAERERRVEAPGDGGALCVERLAAHVL
jgi:tRNA-dihydrouridine synthase C